MLRGVRMTAPSISAAVMLTMVIRAGSMTRGEMSDVAVAAGVGVMDVTVAGEDVLIVTNSAVVMCLITILRAFNIILPLGMFPIPLDHHRIQLFNADLSTVTDVTRDL